MSHAAFLSAIRAAPDDDAPRLVYADYLEERGDAPRAEFIRVQCELARLGPTDARRPALEDREHELLAAHERKWLGVPFDTLEEWRFRRGFVDDITARPGRLPDELFRRHPVESWSLTHDVGEYNSTAVDAIPYLSELRHLDLRSYLLDIGDYVPLLHVDEPGRLESINVETCNGILDLPGLVAGLPCILQLRGLYAGSSRERAPFVALAGALAEAPVEKLGLMNSLLTSADLRHLFAPTLRSLDVSDNRLTKATVAAFASAPAAMELNWLDVSANEVATESLGDLLAAPCLRSLTALEINHCDGGRANVEALAASPFWAQAKELRARVGTVSALALDALCRPDGPTTLGVLDLSDNHLGDRSIERIAAAPWAGSLHWLSLSRNDLSDRAVRAVARGDRFRNLRTLHLAHNARVHGGITDAGAVALAEAPSLAGLRVLTLNDTAISRAGIDILLNAPHWRLSALGVGACLLGPPVVRVLANSPRLARLNWLDLSFNLELGGRALMPLAESPYLSPLCELDLAGVDVADAVADRFRERLGPRLSL